MIKEFVEQWELRKHELREKYQKMEPSCYSEIVRDVVGLLSNTWAACNPDPERIHEIDDGSYQGTLVYVIGEQGYQPDIYWYVRVYYGSCSGCDTLQALQSYTSPTEDQVEGFMTLALHILLGLKQMGED